MFPATTKLLYEKRACLCLQLSGFPLFLLPHVPSLRPANFLSKTPLRVCAHFPPLAQASTKTPTEPSSQDTPPPPLPLLQSMILTAISVINTKSDQDYWPNASQACPCIQQSPENPDIGHQGPPVCPCPLSGSSGDPHSLVTALPAHGFLAGPRMLTVPFPPSPSRVLLFRRVPGAPHRPVLTHPSGLPTDVTQRKPCLTPLPKFKGPAVVSNHILAFPSDIWSVCNYHPHKNSRRTEAVSTAPAINTMPSTVPDIYQVLIKYLVILYYFLSLYSMFLCCKQASFLKDTLFTPKHAIDHQNNTFQSEICYEAGKWKTDSNGSILIPAGVLLLKKYYWFTEILAFNIKISQRCQRNPHECHTDATFHLNSSKLYSSTRQ